MTKQELIKLAEHRINYWIRFGDSDRYACGSADALKCILYDIIKLDEKSKENEVKA